MYKLLPLTVQCTLFPGKQHFHFTCHDCQVTKSLLHFTLQKKSHYTIYVSTTPQSWFISKHQCLPNTATVIHFLCMFFVQPLWCLWRLPCLLYCLLHFYMMQEIQFINLTAYFYISRLTINISRLLNDFNAQKKVSISIFYFRINKYIFWTHVKKETGFLLILISSGPKWCG